MKIWKRCTLSFKEDRTIKIRPDAVRNQKYVSSPYAPEQLNFADPHSNVDRDEKMNDPHSKVDREEVKEDNIQHLLRGQL